MHTELNYNFRARNLQLFPLFDSLWVATEAEDNLCIFATLYQNLHRIIARNTSVPEQTNFRWQSVSWFQVDNNLSKLLSEFREKSLEILLKSTEIFWKTRARRKSGHEKCIMSLQLREKKVSKLLYFVKIVMCTLA